MFFEKVIVFLSHMLRTGVTVQISLEKRGDGVTKTKFEKIWNLLKLSKRLLLQISLTKNQRVGANQSRSRRVASYTQIRTCVLEVTRKF